jgi:hypothetical protein
MMSPGNVSAGNWNGFRRQDSPVVQATCLGSVAKEIAEKHAGFQQLLKRDVVRVHASQQNVENLHHP